jgi:hypothetical protein
MPAPFMAAERRYIALTARYRSGILDEEAFRAKIQEMAFRYKDGAFWTIGGRDARWYRYDGQQWAPQDPPVTQRSSESRTITADKIEQPISAPGRPVVVPRYDADYPPLEPRPAKQPPPKEEPIARNVRWLLIGCASSAILLFICLVMLLVARIIYSQFLY